MSEVKDNEAVYDATISPLMKKVIEVCKRHDIPMIASFEYAPEMSCTTRIAVDGEAECFTKALSLLMPEYGHRPMTTVITKGPDGNVKNVTVIA